MECRVFLKTNFKSVLLSYQMSGTKGLRHSLFLLSFVTWLSNKKNSTGIQSVSRMHFQKNALWLTIFLNFPEKKKKIRSVWGSIPHEDSELFLCPTLVTRRKKSYSISLPSSKLPISISSYKYDAIDIAVCRVRVI